MSQIDTLKQIVQDAIDRFEGNAAFSAANRGEFTTAHYRQLLLHLFYQTYEGPSSFALAGVSCAPRHKGASEYLLHHAEEENLHYRWLLNDLRSVGYDGPDLATALPPPVTLAYVAFNFYIAQRQPLARLGIALVLEGIAAQLGSRYGRKMLESTGLKAENCSFFNSHAVLDVRHCDDLWAVIEGLELSEQEWAWMGQAARTAGQLYGAIYDAAMAA